MNPAHMVFLKLFALMIVEGVAVYNQFVNQYYGNFFENLAQDIRLAITAFKHYLSFKLITIRIADKYDRDCIYLNDMTLLEKNTIPNLEKQVRKALRVIIPLPLDTSNLLEEEILMEQNSTYFNKTDDFSLAQNSLFK